MVYVLGKILCNLILSRINELCRAELGNLQEKKGQGKKGIAYATLLGTTCETKEASPALDI